MLRRKFLEWIALPTAPRYIQNEYLCGEKSMASTSVSLGPHWEGFIRSEIESGRYKNMSEVVRAGLRELEERREKLNALREHLVTGYEQAQHGEFVDDASPEDIVARAKARAATKE